MKKHKNSGREFKGTDPLQKVNLGRGGQEGRERPLLKTVNGKQPPSPLGITDVWSRYYGVRACLALWDHRPKEILRVYVTDPTLDKFRDLLRWCASNKKAYHIVDDVTLEKITESVHHEGVCIVAKPLLPTPEEKFLGRVANVKTPTLLYYLDGVQNPHNLGSILRSGVNFGVPYCLMQEWKQTPASTCRIAEGAAEILKMVELKNVQKAVATLKKQGFEIFATSCHAEHSLYDQPLPEKSLVLFGNEVHGISPEILKLASKTIRIPGTGSIQSLNVSISSALIAAEFWRTHQKNDASREGKSGAEGKNTSEKRAQSRKTSL